MIAGPKTRFQRRVVVPILAPILKLRHRYDLRNWRHGAWNRIEQIAARAQAEGSRPVILIGLHHRIGDIVMATAVIRQLRARHPEAILVFATQSRFRDVLSANPHLDHIVDCDCIGTLIDLAAHPAFQSAHLLTLDGDRCELCGAVFRDTHRPFVEMGLGYMDWYCHRRHLLELWLEQLELDTTDVEPEIRIPDNVAARMRGQLEQGRVLRRGPLVAIHTRTPHWPAKQWPLENSFQLMRRLIGEKDAHIVVIGTEPVAGLPLGVHDMTGQTSLIEIAALLAEVDLFIGPDSGPGHLASAVGTPSIVMFGPTDPDTCRPRGRSVITLWHGAELDGPMRVDVRPGTRANRDMAQISVDEVMEAAQSLLGERQTALLSGAA